MMHLPRGRQNDVVIQRLDGELLVYVVESDRAVCLNEGAAAVWQACDGETTIAGIREAVIRALGTPVDDEFVLLALDDLRKEGLLADEDEAAPALEGLTRREMIRRVGLTTAAALPLVTSVTVPSAAEAQSVAFCAADACACIGMGNVASCSALLGGCGGGCTACTVTATCFLPGGEGALVCPGVCTQTT